MPIFGSMLMLLLHELSAIITVLFSNYECESIAHSTIIVFNDLTTNSTNSTQPLC
jgi:hypothetical protein